MDVDSPQAIAGPPPIASAPEAVTAPTLAPVEEPAAGDVQIEPSFFSAPAKQPYSWSLGDATWSMGDATESARRLARRLRLRTQVAAPSTGSSRATIPLDAFGGGTPMMSKPAVTAPPPTRRRRGRGNDSDSDDDDDDDDEVTTREKEDDPRKRFAYNPKTKGGKHIPLNRAGMLVTEERPVSLVPIRIDVDMQGYRIVDSFLWNLNERAISAHQFSVLLCEDLDMPESLAPSIAESIRDQLTAYRALEVAPAPVEGDNVIVNLDLHVGSIHLRDRFLWDPSHAHMNPDEFARQLTADLGLGGEFPANIAQAIYESVASHRRRRLMTLMGNAARGETEDDLLVTEAIAIRDERDAGPWAPVVHVMDEAEKERLQEESERTARRRRRAGDVSMSDLIMSTSRASRRGAAAGLRTAYVAEAASEAELDELLGPDAEEEQHPDEEASSGRGMAREGARERFLQLQRIRMATVMAQQQAGHGKPFTHGPHNIRDAHERAMASAGRYRGSATSANWRCEHCGIRAEDTPGLRKGPNGHKTLCNACGLYWSIRGFLPAHRHNLADKMAAAGTKSAP